MRSSIAGTLATVLVLALAVGAAREAAATEHGVCAVLDSPFPLAEIAEKAEAAVPGDALKAGALSYGYTDHRAVSLRSRLEV